MTGEPTGGVTTGDVSRAASGGGTPRPLTTDVAVLSEQIAALQRDIDTMLPHVVRALTRDEAHDALVARLDAAERRLEARSVQPLALAVAHLLHDVRRLDRRDLTSALQHLQHVENELSAILRRHGFEEFGTVGELFDQQRHVAATGRVTEDGAGVVADVVTHGLTFGDDVVIRAEVRVRPVDGTGGDR